MVTVDDDTDDYAEYDEDFEELSQDDQTQSMAVTRELGLSETKAKKAAGDRPPRTPARGRRPGRHTEAAAAPQGQTISEQLAAAHSEATGTPRAQQPKRRQPKQVPSRPPSALNTSRPCSPLLEAPLQPGTLVERPTTSQIAPVSNKVETAQNSESVAVALSAIPLSGSGPRPVRGRITVSNDAESDTRPDTGGSDKGKSNKPMWLQFDSAVRRQPSSGDLQQPSRGREVPRPSTSPSSGSRTRMPPRSADGGACDNRLASADGDGGDRKTKRLQHEIQKLTQRLKEAEGFSAEDDGLPNFTADQVDVGQMIAQGGFASVHHAFWRSTPCAMKRIFDPVITAELKADFDNEVRMLRRLRHPNIVTLMAVCRVPPHLSFLTEYLDGGCLFEMLHSPAKPGSGKDCNTGTLPHILKQAASALAFMHATEVVHRDVKSHNLLLAGRGPRPPTKLCDFGLARMKSELCAGTMQWAGTPPYMAPELFEKKRYTEGVDVFAFAVLLWESAAGDIPHANLEAADIFERVRSKDSAGLPVPPGWPMPLKALLRAALCPKQESRPSMADVIRQLKSFSDFPNPLDGS
mmetsp:Transcript_99684/g.197645  ORF Transcript_99684/g.197645 Transcript_99684/m.197645 type:complete len:578 (-) Transcript_99684:194-1927(-)